MKWRRFGPHILLWIGGLGVTGWNFVERPFPRLVQIRSLTWCTITPPIFYASILAWYCVSPFVVVVLSGLFVMSVWKVWLEGRRRDFAPFGTLPPWPLDARQPSPIEYLGVGSLPIFWGLFQLMMR